MVVAVWDLEVLVEDVEALVLDFCLLESEVGLAVEEGDLSEGWRDRLSSTSVQ